VMEDEYIPNYRIYGETDAPLAFFAYIAGAFGANINSQINQIHDDTGINGSAVPVDLLINFAQDYAENGYDHRMIREAFSVNREVRLEDIEPDYAEETADAPDAVRLFSHEDRQAAESANEYDRAPEE